MTHSVYARINMDFQGRTPSSEIRNKPTPAKVTLVWGVSSTIVNTALDWVVSHSLQLILALGGYLQHRFSKGPFLVFLPFPLLHTSSFLLFPLPSPILISLSTSLLDLFIQPPSYPFVVSPLLFLFPIRKSQCIHCQSMVQSCCAYLHAFPSIWDNYCRRKVFQVSLAATHQLQQFQNLRSLKDLTVRREG